jgi:hypothetical protein
MIGILYSGKKGCLVFVSGCRPTLGPTQPNIQSLLRVPATGGRHLEREFDNSALCIAEVYKSEMGSSVSIVFGYGMNNQKIEVRSRQRQWIFPLASASRPALGPTQLPVQWVAGALSPGLKCGRGVTLTTHPQLMPRLRMSRSYTSSIPSAFVACSETALAFKDLQEVEFYIHDYYMLQDRMFTQKGNLIFIFAF